MSHLAAASIYTVTGSKLHPIIVELTTDDGISGIGEAALAYGIGGRAGAAMAQEICARIAIGKDPARIEALWSEMYDHTFWAKGGGPVVFAAISAIETALWDIKGKQLGAPVYELLGGLVHESLPVYANGWNYEFHEAEAWARAAERPLRDGYTALKCYPFAVPTVSNRTIRHVTRRAIDSGLSELAFQRVRALRDVVGAEIEILVDLSGGLTTDQTIRFCDRIEQFRIGWIEEPADPFDLGAYAKIAAKVRTPLAAGERHYTRYGFRKLLETQAIEIAQPDVGTAGGIMETKKIAAMAEAYNMRFAPHNCAGGAATAAAMHVGACSSNFMTLEVYPYFRSYPGYVEVLQDNPELGIKDGALAVQSGPGLGVTLDHAALRPFLFAEVTAAST
jgi:galactonate dehydratase